MLGLKSGKRVPNAPRNYVAFRTNKKDTRETKAPCQICFQIKWICDFARFYSEEKQIVKYSDQSKSQNLIFYLYISSFEESHMYELKKN